MRLESSLIRGGEPVDERTETGLVVGAAIEDEIADHLEEKRQLLLGAGGAVVGGIVLWIFFLTQVGGTLGWLALLAGVVGGGGLYYLGSNREPDVEVKNVQKRYWTGHLIPQRKGAMVFDATNSIEPATFEFEQLEDPGRLGDAVDRFTTEPELPVVLPPEDDVESRIEAELREVRTELENTVSRQESVPVFDEDAPIVRGIDSIAEYATGSTVETGSIEIDRTRAQNAAEAIEELETLAFEDDVEETLAAFKDTSERTVDRITETQELAVELLNDHIGTASDILATASYNFYCPDCLDDDVTSPLEPVDDPETLRWRCETCRGEFSREDEPMPKHRIKDELVEGIWDQLWIEKDDERRRIYENIEDQKEELKEREFEEKREEIRDTWNRIKDRRAKIRDLRTEATAAKASAEKLTLKMYEYDRLRDQRKREFEKDIQSAVEGVQRQVERQIESIRGFEEQQTEKAREEASRLAELRRAEEEERHRERQAMQALAAGEVDTAEEAHERAAEARKRRRLAEAEVKHDDGITKTISKVGAYLDVGESQRGGYE